MPDPSPSSERWTTYWCPQHRCLIDGVSPHDCEAYVDPEQITVVPESLLTQERQRLSEYKAVEDKWATLSAARDRESRARVEELEGALGKIAEPMYGGGPAGMAKIARAALSGKEASDAG